MSSTPNQIVISGLSRQSLIDMLGLSKPTFSRYLKALDERLKGCPFWQYANRQRGYNESTAKAIAIYTSLAQQFGVSYANENIVKELKNNGYQFVQNNQRQDRHQRDETGGNRSQTGDYYTDLFSR